MGLLLCLGFITYFRDGSSERGEGVSTSLHTRSEGVIASSQIKFCSAEYCVLS